MYLIGIKIKLVACKSNGLLVTVMTMSVANNEQRIQLAKHSANIDMQKIGFYCAWNRVNINLAIRGNL